MNCPRCLSRLNRVTVKLNEVYHSKILRGVGLTQQLDLDQCLVCTGIWFDAGELQKYLAEKVTIVDSQGRDYKSWEAADQKVGKCPRCGINMHKEPAPKDPSITIDKCRKCHGIWLDSLELDALENANLTLMENFLAKLARIF